MSKRAIFDFSNTCPRIDKAMRDAEAVVARHIDTILEEACPLLSRRARDEYSEAYTESLFRDLQDAFETVRSTNEDMRRAAEDQIERLACELDAAEAANA
jgi:hypothetical protein